MSSTGSPHQIKCVFRDESKRVINIKSNFFPGYSGCENAVLEKAKVLCLPFGRIFILQVFKDNTLFVEYKDTYNNPYKLKSKDKDGKMVVDHKRVKLMKSSVKNKEKKPVLRSFKDLVK